MKAIMKAENYISIQGWMRTELELSGTELLLYAVIYGFSQAGMGRFTGTVAYLADWAGCTPRNVKRVLAGMVDDGLLIREGTNNAPEYIAVRHPEPKEEPKTEPKEENPELGVPVENSKNEPVENSEGVKKCHPRGEIMSLQGVKKCHPRGDIMSPNNIYKYNNNIYIHTALSAHEADVDNSTVDNSPDTVGGLKSPTERKAPYGVNKNVYLTPSEHRELWRLIPRQARRYVDRLSRWKVGRVQTMDDYQRLRGWMEQDRALVKERELDALARVEEELLDDELAEVERRLMRKGASNGN